MQKQESYFIPPKLCTQTNPQSSTLNVFESTENLETLEILIKKPDKLLLQKKNSCFNASKCSSQISNIVGKNEIACKEDFEIMSDIPMELLLAKPNKLDHMQKQISCFETPQSCFQTSPKSLLVGQDKIAWNDTRPNKSDHSQKPISFLSGCSQTSPQSSEFNTVAQNDIASKDNPGFLNPNALEVSLTPNCNSQKEKHKSRKTKLNIRSSKHKISNSLRKTIVDSQSKCVWMNFLFKKLILPLFMFSFFLVFLIFAQKYIQDYCFYPGLCFCSSIGVYFYTFLRELLQFDVIVLGWSYFSAAYLTHNFYQTRKAIYLFFLSEMLILLVFYFVLYEKRNDAYLSNFRILRSSAVTFFGGAYVIVFTAAKKKFSKPFFKKIVKLGFFTAFYFIHGLLIKNTLTLYLLKMLLLKYPVKLALNIFKMIYIVYYFLYNFIAKHLVHSFYEELLENPGSFPLEMIITVTKFISIDVVSVQIMNVLTFPLTNEFFWVSLFIYLYSIVGNYTGYSVYSIFIALLKKIFKRKKKNDAANDDKHKKEIKQNWDELRRGCLLESNLIVFMRIFILFLFDPFSYFTKLSTLFADCSLKPRSYVKGLDMLNMILVFSLHTVIIIVLFSFMVKKKKMVLELVVEDFGIVLRAVFFLMYYTQIDVCIQFYLFLGLLK